jgi:hypothetical protein
MTTTAKSYPELLAVVLVSSINANNGLWLEGPVQLNRRFMNETCPEAIRSADRREASLWSKRRDMLAEHREYCKSIKGK